jgi:aspartate/methionine/tyrosine aminotransferase
MRVKDVPSYDLACGYPNFDGEPAFLSTLSRLSQSGSVKFRAPVGSAFDTVEERLLDNFRRRLDVPDRYERSMCATLNGSIAINRAFAALRNYARELGKQKLAVFVPYPIIEILFQIPRELRDVELFFCKVDMSLRESWANFSSWVAAKCAELQSYLPVVILCDPNNPTAHRLSGTDLFALDNVVANYNGVFVADHCFYLISKPSSEQIKPIWSEDQVQSKWIGIWDTGKTFDLRGLKLSFIVCSDSDIHDHIQTGNDLLVFEAGSFIQSFINEVLESELHDESVSYIRYFSRKNRQTAAAALGEFVDIHGDFNGSHLWCKLKEAHPRGIYIQRDRNSRICVKSGLSFFPNDWEGQRYIRLSLARPEAYFQKAVEQLVSEFHVREPAPWI